MSIFVFFGLILFVIMFATCSYGLSALTRYCSKSDGKNTTYECGSAPIGDARVSFEPKYLVYAVVFLLFEAETILLFPYALSADKLGLYGVVEVAIFILILLFGLWFIVKSDILRFR